MVDHEQAVHLGESLASRLPSGNLHAHWNDPRLARETGAGQRLGTRIHAAGAAAQAAGSVGRSTPSSEGRSGRLSSRSPCRTLTQEVAMRRSGAAKRPLSVPRPRASACGARGAEPSDDASRPRSRLGGRAADRLRPVGRAGGSNASVPTVALLAAWRCSGFRDAAPGALGASAPGPDQGQVVRGPCARFPRCVYPSGRAPSRISGSPGKGRAGGFGIRRRRFGVHCSSERSVGFAPEPLARHRFGGACDGESEPRLAAECNKSAAFAWSKPSRW